SISTELPPKETAFSSISTSILILPIYCATGQRPVVQCATGSVRSARGGGRFCPRAGRFAIQRIVEGCGYGLTASAVIDADGCFMAAVDKVGSLPTPATTCL